MNNTGVTGHPILTLSMRVFDPRDSAYAVGCSIEISRDICNTVGLQLSEHVGTEGCSDK